MEYIDSGGRLVWTGDAGTELEKEDEYLYKDEIDANSFLQETIDTPSEFPSHEIISPWARKISDEDKIIRFDHYISAGYTSTWCQVRDCKIYEQIGTMVPEAGADHKFIYGLKQNLRLYGDFALVKDMGIGSTRVLSVDTQGKVFDEEKRDLGRVFPLIIASGVGEKVVYYAVPPELFTQEPMKYWLFIENLYDGMLR
jgi:hypothetical protein